MKVFISQPMRDRTQEEIENERAKLIELVRERREGEKVSEIASYFGPAATFDPMEYLGMAIQMMNRADLVVFAPDWEKARGCRIEHICAEEYGIDIMHSWADPSTGQYWEFKPSEK